MADLDLRCVNCFHRSHENKECPYCDPQNRCQEFVRADLFVARSMGRIEGFLQQSHGQLIMALSTIFDLLAESNPEAAERMKTKLEARQAAMEAEMEIERATVRAEANSALKEATDAEEEQAMEKLAEGHMDNVIPFPVKLSVSESPEPAPEVV